MTAVRWRIWMLQALTIGVGLAAWELVARFGWVDPLFVPAPTGVVRAFGRIGTAAMGGLVQTLAKTAIAYIIAVVLGIGAGLVIGSSRILSRTVDPFVVALY